MSYLEPREACETGLSLVLPISTVVNCHFNASWLYFGDGSSVNNLEPFSLPSIQNFFYIREKM